MRSWLPIFRVEWEVRVTPGSCVQRPVLGFYLRWHWHTVVPLGRWK
jgi:hypothetical protein